MATVFIQKRKRKIRSSYVIYYKDPSTLKLKYFKTYQRQKEANQAAHELRALIDTGKSHEVEEKKTKLNFFTFSQVSEQLKIKWNKRLLRGDLRKKTFDEYLYMLNALDRIFGKRLLCEISTDDITNYRDEVTSVFSAVTFNRNLFIIKQVFKHGLKVRAVLDDPTAGIKYLSEKEHERNRFILPEEICWLVEVSKKTRAKFYMPTLIYLGAEHGASKQEALSLKWKNINFDLKGRGTINFYRTKNSRERTEYIMPRTREALLAWREHQRWMRHRKRIDAGDSDLVFCRLNGTPIKRFDNAWRAVCRIAGIKDFHFHDLRHTFCSNLLLAGCDLKDVKEMIGHSDISMTDRYSHLTPDHKLIQQNRLTEHYTNGG